MALFSYPSLWIRQWVKRVADAYPVRVHYDQTPDAFFFSFNGILFTLSRNKGNFQLAEKKKKKKKKKEQKVYFSAILMPFTHFSAILFQGS